MKVEALPRFREELNKELKENILSWWMHHAPDRERGGFYGHIDHRNRVVNGAGTMAPDHAFGGVRKQRELLEGEGVLFRENGCIDMKKCLWRPAQL